MDDIVEKRRQRIVDILSGKYAKPSPNLWMNPSYATTYDNAYGEFFNIPHTKDTFDLAYGDESEEKFDEFVTLYERVSALLHGTEFARSVEYDENDLMGPFPTFVSNYLSFDNAKDFTRCLDSSFRNVDNLVQTLEAQHAFGGHKEFSPSDKEDLRTAMEAYVKLCEIFRETRHFAICNLSEEQLEQYRTAKLTEAKKVLGNIQLSEAAKNSTYYNTAYNYFRSTGTSTSTSISGIVGRYGNEYELAGQYHALEKYISFLETASLEELRENMLGYNLTPALVEKYSSDLAEYRNGLIQETLARESESTLDSENPFSDNYDGQEVEHEQVQEQKPSLENPSNLTTLSNAGLEALAALRKCNEQDLNLLSGMIPNMILQSREKAQSDGLKI